MIKHILLLVIFLFNLSMDYPRQISIMTYNIRFDNPNDEQNTWESRKDFLVDQLRFHEPSIIGTQEGLLHQIQYIDNKLNDYHYFGVGRDNGKEEGEFSAVFYDSTEYDLLKDSTFWLSETPGEPSVGWDAALERICTWGLFEHKATSEKFWVFNTHLDHVGKIARQNSVRLIMEKINILNGSDFPVILMGDFNLEPKSQPIQELNKEFHDSKKHSKIVSFGPEGTYNGFDYNEDVSRRIDYIFVSPDVKVMKYGVLSDAIEGKYPSDHFPVYVTIQLFED
ncbi:MAG: endonuclease/exonuclease/phosphatase family protein [Bacteroidales bacterium]